MSLSQVNFQSFLVVQFIHFEKASKLWQKLQISFKNYLLESKKLFRHILVAFSEYMNSKSFFEIIEE